MNDSNASIDGRTTLGTATLAVRDAGRCLAFYRDLLGFELLEQHNGTLRLGAGGTHLLTIEAGAHLRPRPLPSTGLYHVAILLPSRPELARVLRRLIDARIPLGSSDHAVSEALYLNDPDGNGLEIYRDRPHDEWHWIDGQVHMVIERLDAAGILRELPATPVNTLPAGTRIGHMHLQVADLAAAEAFYHGVLGFDITATYPGALFMSAGGYHHHLGLNIWESRGAPVPPTDATGLRAFEIVLPDQPALRELQQRIQAAGYMMQPSELGVAIDDPWRNRLLLRSNHNDE